MPVASFHARWGGKRTDWFALPRTFMCVWKLDFPAHLYLGRPSGVCSSSSTPSSPEIQKLRGFSTARRAGIGRR